MATELRTAAAPGSAPRARSADAAAGTGPVGTGDAGGELRRGAFDAGLLAAAAACLYALALVLVRADGMQRASGAAVCVLMLAVLAAARHEPVAAYARLRRRPMAIATTVGVLLGVGLSVAGTGASLLFLPAVLLLATVGAVVPVRAVVVACALATAGQLSVLVLDDPTAAAGRLVLAAGLGLAVIPVVLAVLVARFADGRPRAPAAEPLAPIAAQPARSMRAAVAAPTRTPSATAATAPPAPEAPATAVLTPRQREVVALTRAGLRHGEIAQRLGVSVQQVRRLLRQARERTGTSTTRELTAWAIAAGLPTQMTENPSETQARLRDD